MFFVTALLYFLHAVVLCNHSSKFSVITSKHVLVNLKIMCFYISFGILNSYGKEDALLIPRKGNTFYLPHHVCNVCVPFVLSLPIHAHYTCPRNKAPSGVKVKNLWNCTATPSVVCKTQ
jgi:hypothetical protein